MVQQRHYPHLSHAELRAKLSAYKREAEREGKKVDTRGNVLQMDQRLFDIESAAGTYDAQTATKKKRRVVRKGLDPTAPLGETEATTSIIWKVDTYHPITIQCLTTLEASSMLSKPHAVRQDESLGNSLKPLLELCNILTTHTTSMESKKELGTAVIENFRALQAAMLPDVERMIDRYSQYPQDPIVAKVIQQWSEKEVATHTKERADLGVSESEAHFEEDSDLQAAIEESLSEQKQNRILDEHQALMETYDDGGPRSLYEVGDGLGEVVPAEEAAECIPPEGFVFSDFLFGLNIQKHDRIVLADFLRELMPLARIQGSNIFRKASDVDGAQLPSDDEVRQEVAMHGKRGLLFEDLIKTLNIRELGVDVAKDFRSGIIARHVVRYNEEGRLVLSQDESMASLIDPSLNDPFLDKPMLTTTGTGVAAGPSEEQFSAGSDAYAPPSLRSAAEVASGVDWPSTGEQWPILSSSHTTTSHPGLAAEVALIQQGMLGRIRRWREHFPEKLIGEWPFDFNTTEKSILRDYIRAYLTKHDMIRQLEPAELDPIVDAVLDQEDFPVAKGKNKPAVLGALKEMNRRLGKAGASGGGAVEENEEGATSGDELSSGLKKKGKSRKEKTGATPNAKRRRKGSAVDSDAGYGDDEGEPEADGDVRMG